MSDESTPVLTPPPGIAQPTTPTTPAAADDHQQEEAAAPHTHAGGTPSSVSRSVSSGQMLAVQPPAADASGLQRDQDEQPAADGDAEPAAATAAATSSTSSKRSDAAQGAVAAAPSEVHTASSHGTFCSYCSERPATVWCAECQMQLCAPNGCDGEIHAVKARSGHQREPLGSHAPIATAAAAEAPEAAAEPAAAPVADPPIVTAAVASPFSSFNAKRHARKASTAVTSPAAVAARAASDAVADGAAIAARPANMPQEFCDHCNSHVATVYCDECIMIQCGACDDEMHALKGNAQHERVKYPIENPPSTTTAAPATSAAPADDDTAAASTEVVKLPADASVASASSAAPSDSSSSTRDPAHPPTSRTYSSVVGASAFAPMCSHCESHTCEVSCSDCREHLCGECDAEIHARPPKSTHARKPFAVHSMLPAPSSTAGVPSGIGGASESAASGAEVAVPDTFCSYCEEHPATVWCDQCSMKLCAPNGCDDELHATKSRAHHQREAWPATNTREEADAHPRSTWKDAPVLAPIQPSPEQEAPAAARVPSSAAAQAAQVLAAAALANGAIVLSDAAPFLPSSLAAPSPPPPPAASGGVSHEFCDHCDSHTATLYCDECILLCCDECDQEVHARKENRRHTRVAYPIQTHAKDEQEEAAGDAPSDPLTAAAPADGGLPSVDASGRHILSRASHPDPSLAQADSPPVAASSEGAPQHADTMEATLTQQQETAGDTPSASAPSEEQQQAPDISSFSHQPSRARTPQQRQQHPRDSSASPLRLNTSDTNSGATRGGLRRPSPSSSPSPRKMMAASAAGTATSPSPRRTLGGKKSAAAAVPSTPTGASNRRSIGAGGSATVPRPGTSAGVMSTIADASPAASSSSSGGAATPGGVGGKKSSGGGGGRNASTWSSSSARPPSDRTSPVTVPPPSSTGGGVEVLSLERASSPLPPRSSTPTDRKGDHDRDRDSALMLKSTGNAEKDKVNYNYVLYSLRNKVTKLEEHLDDLQTRFAASQDQVRANYDGFTREQARRKEAESHWHREKAEHATCQAQAKKAEHEREDMAVRLEAFQQASEEQARARHQERTKLHESLTVLEKQVAFHSAASAEKSSELVQLKNDLQTRDERIRDLEKEVKKQKDLNATYRSYSTQYESLILTLREKLGEAERKQIGMAKWKVKANQYAEEWEAERRKMKRKMAKQVDMIDAVRKDLKDYRAILKFVAVRGYVNQWLLRRALRKVFIQACDMATTNLIDQIEATPKVHNSVQMDSIEDLSVRNSKLINEWPWGNQRGPPPSAATHSMLLADGSGAPPGSSASGSSHSRSSLLRFPPIVCLVKSIQVQLHTCSEASALIRAQKRKWQETADSFFQRNIELTNSYLTSDLELLSHKKKSSALRSHTRALQAQHVELEAQLQQAIGEKQRIAAEIEQIERTARQEKAVVNIVHAKKFERSVELSRRCLALEDELRRLRDQRAKLSAEVGEAGEERRALAALAAKEQANESAEYSAAAHQQSALLAWSTRSELGISSPTRGMVSSKREREMSPQRHPTQAVHYVAATPQPPPDAFEQKQPPHQVATSAGGARRQPPVLPQPDFNYAAVSRPVTAFTGVYQQHQQQQQMAPVPVQLVPQPFYTTPIGPPGFFYAQSPSGQPVLAKSTGRPVTIPTNGMMPTGTGQQQQQQQLQASPYPGMMAAPKDFSQSAYAYNTPIATPMQPARPRSSTGGRSSRPTSSTTTNPANSSAAEPYGSGPLPSTKSPAYIMPMLAAYTSPMTLPRGAVAGGSNGTSVPSSRSVSRPSSSPGRRNAAVLASLPVGSKEAKAYTRRQQHVDTLNRSILDAAMQRAARRQGGGVTVAMGKGQTLTGARAAGSRAAHLQANLIKRPPPAAAEATATGEDQERLGSPSTEQQAQASPQPPPQQLPSPPPVTSLKAMLANSTNPAGAPADA